jgi:hypothetical protein
VTFLLDVNVLIALIDSAGSPAAVAPIVASFGRSCLLER